MNPITREQLEREKISPLTYSKIECNFKYKCTRAGSYIRCGMESYVLCPFYRSYMAQSKLETDTEG